MLPPCFLPASTIRRWFCLWHDNGLWLTLNHPLLLAAISNRFQRLRQVFANGGCAGDELKQALDGIDK